MDVFILEEHDVIYSILDEDEGVKWTQSNCAKLLFPPICWKSKCTQVGWQFNWSLKGIQPVRAVVMVTADVTVPSGKIFCFI